MRTMQKNETITDNNSNWINNEKQHKNVERQQIDKQQNRPDLFSYYIGMNNLPMRRTRMKLTIQNKPHVFHKWKAL